MNTVTHIEEPADAKAAAKFIGVHVSTLKRIDARELPYSKPRSRRRYEWNDLRAYKARHTRGTNVTRNFRAPATYERPDQILARLRAQGFPVSIT